jgi:hypothetical protein
MSQELQRIKTQFITAVNSHELRFSFCYLNAAPSLTPKSFSTFARGQNPVKDA